MIKRKRKAALAKLEVFFKEKGRVYSAEEYAAAVDKPVAGIGVRNLFSTNSKMLSAFNRAYPNFTTTAAPKAAPKAKTEEVIVEAKPKSKEKPNKPFFKKP